MNDGLMFTGFPAAGLALLERLPTFDKAEFEHHRDAWENELRLPAHHLAQAVGTRLVEEVSAGFVSQSQLHGLRLPHQSGHALRPDRTALQGPSPPALVGGSCEEGGAHSHGATGRHIGRLRNRGHLCVDRQIGELRWGNRKSPYAWWQRSTR